MNKRQIMAFLDPNLVERARAKANAEDKTIQEVAGEAINRCLELHGAAPVINGGHLRVFRRIRGRSKPKSEAKVTSSRVGKRTFGGWYPKEEVEIVREFARSRGMTIQSLMEEGLTSLLNRPSE